jgi:hypothetical protein
LSSFLSRPFSAGGIAGGPLTAPGSGARLHGRPQRLFAAVVVLTCLAHSLTLTRSPPAWQDEVQIIDYGRTILPGSDRSHGVNWIDRHRPIELLNCIGPLIQETACRLSSTTMLGPRVAALLGAAAAAAVLRGWLVAAGVSPWIASTGGLAFLWDPLFASSYRGARVDSWCMAAILASLWCIRLAGRPGGGSVDRRAQDELAEREAGDRDRFAGGTLHGDSRVGLAEVETEAGGERGGDERHLGAGIEEHAQAPADGRPGLRADSGCCW